jgi:hypothetical protein
MAQLSDRPVKTYSIGFDGDDSFYNELPYARMVADKFHTDHHEIIVRPDVTELLPKLIWHMDEPVADSALITTYLVSRLARESVTVILSGVGGDELFGGYRRYLGENLLGYNKALEFIRKSWLPYALAHLSAGSPLCLKNNIRYTAAFVKAAQDDIRSRATKASSVYFSRATPQSALISTLLKGASDLSGEYFALLLGRRSQPTHLRRHEDLPSRRSSPSHRQDDYGRVHRMPRTIHGCRADRTQQPHAGNAESERVYLEISPQKSR